MDLEWQECREVQQDCLEPCRFVPEALERVVKADIGDHSFWILTIQSSSPRALPGDSSSPDRVLIGGPTTEEAAAAAEVLAVIYAKGAPQERIIM